MPERAYALFEVVAPVHDVEGTGLRVGQTGTLIDLLLDSAYEVEFCDSFRNTIMSRGFLSHELRPVDTARASDTSSSLTMTGAATNG